MLIADICFHLFSLDKALKPRDTFDKNSLPSSSIRSSFLLILLLILSSTGISNRNVIRFQSTPLAKTKTAREVNLIAQSISSSATATVRIVGVQTGLTAIISVQVNADPGSSNSPDAPDDPSSGNGGTGSYT